MDSANDLPEPPALDRPPTYASTDPAHPTVEVNHQPSPDVTFSTLSPTAAHEYSVIGVPSGMEVKQGENALYFVGRFEALDRNDVVLYAGYDQHGPQLARADFAPTTKDFKFYVGGLKSPKGDDWDVVRYASEGKLFTTPFYRFEAPALEGANGKQKYHWKKTHNSKLGASKLSSNDYKLVDEATEAVVGVFTETLRAGSFRGTVHFPRKPNSAFEIASLVVLFSLLEKSRRHSRAVHRAVPSGITWQ